MGLEALLIYKTKDEIVASLIQRFQARIPDIWTEEDGVFRIFCEVFAAELEGVYLANQLLRDDMFIQRAGISTLELKGDEYGLPLKDGTPSAGNLLFSGSGGTVIPEGSSACVTVTDDDILYFVTTEEATIPDPGIPDALTAVDSAVGGNPVAGTYEYAVTFTTTEGETLPGLVSTPVTTALAHKITLSNIPTGGAGTLHRKIYRAVNGGAFAFLTTIIDNATTGYLDNTATPVGAVPAVSTAERITVTAQSDDVGLAYNVAIGAVIEIADVPDGVTDVTNIAAFTGGGDPEDMEVYRLRLLDHIRSPKSGSISDLEAWAEEIYGVDQATAFSNMNGVTPTNGHVTVYIVGPGGTVPDAPKQAEVLAALEALDIANMTIHVATFTPKTINVAVTVTLDTGYALADVTAGVEAAVTAYVNGVAVHETVYVAGITDAVFGDVPGVLTLVVTTPGSNQTSAATEKPVIGTITVTS
jgi:hypothetical protein